MLLEAANSLLTAESQNMFALRILIITCRTHLSARLLNKASPEEQSLLTLYWNPITKWATLRGKCFIKL